MINTIVSSRIFLIGLPIILIGSPVILLMISSFNSRFRSRKSVENKKD